MTFLCFTSPCPVLCYGPGPRANLVPVLGPGPGPGPGHIIFFVPALVPVPSYFCPGQNILSCHTVGLVLFRIFACDSFKTVEI